MSSKSANLSKTVMAAALGAVWLLAAVAAAPSAAFAQTVSYENMPEIPAIGIRTGKYKDVPEFAKGPPIDPAEGYRIQVLGKDLYMVTENVHQAMLLVYGTGVVVADVPQALAAAMPKAIAEITNKPVTHLIYSHSHADHIGGTRRLGGQPIIIAHEETKRLLARANDPDRPFPTVTFTDTYTLTVGSHKLELSYHGDGHEPATSSSMPRRRRS
jgi:hypothetical protein